MRVRQMPQSEPPVTDWHVSHAPASNNQATATRAAALPVGQPGTGSRNVLNALVVVLAAGATAPTAAAFTVAVIDGASGGTNYLWGPMAMSIPNIAGAMNGIAMSGLWIPGSPNTPMTIEFSGAPGANAIESVWMAGTTE